MKYEHPTKFYARVMRNLNILRDIQKVIDDGRNAYRNTITFDDENGERWMLKKIPPANFSPKVKSEIAA